MDIQWTGMRITRALLCAKFWQEGSTVNLNGCVLVKMESPSTQQDMFTLGGGGVQVTPGGFHPEMHVAGGDPLALPWEEGLGQDGLWWAGLHVWLCGCVNRG